VVRHPARGGEAGVVTAPASHPNPSEASLEPTGLVDEAVELLLRPGRFFRALSERRLRGLWVVFALLAGLSSAADRIDQRLLFADLLPGGRRSGVEAVTGDWAAYWIAVASGGLVLAVPLYWIAGWWLGIRTRWSGAARVDWALARQIEVFATAVFAVPWLVWAGIETAWFESYRASFDSGEFLELYLFGTLVWSSWVKYRGMSATHEVRQGRAIFWLLALPLAFYAMVFGGALGYILWPWKTAQ
jgi:hypothetical protein